MMLEALRGEKESPRSGIQAIALGAQARTVLVPLVMRWRREFGVPVYMDFEDRKIAAHFKIADRNKARYAVILGSEELATGELILRDLAARTERRLSLDGADLAAELGEGNH
jgi:histidyl-tRNA synthetase